MAMRNPPHPGGIVRRQCLDPLSLSVTEAAKGLGVTRQALSDLVNGKAGTLLIWQFAFRRSSVRVQRPGSGYKWRMIYGRRACAHTLFKG